MWIIHYRNFGEELGLQDQVPSIINGGPRKWIFTIVLEGLFQVGPIYEWINRHMADYGSQFWIWWNRNRPMQGAVPVQFRFEQVWFRPSSVLVLVPKSAIFFLYINSC